MKDIDEKILPLLGAICGDVVGSRFEMNGGEKLLHLQGYPLIEDGCQVTDDTVFTIAIAQCLLDGTITPQDITASLQKWGRKYPDAGFGYTTRAWIFAEHPTPYGSTRNGAAMRVSPCGVFADSLDQALELARVTAEVSHNSREGVRGAQAIAAAVYLARQGKSKEEIKAYITDSFGYDLDKTVEELKDAYHGFSCLAVDTVPQAIICFLESTDVETAIRYGISLGSDADTIASMAAAIAAAYYREIPFLDQVLPLVPQEMLDVLGL